MAKKYKIGDRVAFDYTDGYESGTGTVVDVTTLVGLVGVDSDDKLLNIRHNCNGRAKEDHGLWIAPEDLIKIPPTKEPMAVVDHYHATKKVTTPFDEQVGGGHYKTMTIQPVEFILANELGFCEGNIIKYTCRYKQKGGIQDLKKVIHYAEMLIADIESEEGKPS